LANGVAIEIKTELESVPSVAGHESELREVLTNLVFNAVDAMPNSGSITLRTKVDGDAVRLEVSDTGTGIPLALQSRVFDPFFTTKDQGTGLGLAIVHALVEAHHGRIDVESRPGQGTSFVMRLPQGSIQQPTLSARNAALVGRSVQTRPIENATEEETYE
jgi:signal transduction histidine kinase